jgi:hypothetical protein
VTERSCEFFDRHDSRLVQAPLCADVASRLKTLQLQKAQGSYMALIR